MKGGMRNQEQGEWLEACASGPYNRLSMTAVGTLNRSHLFTCSFTHSTHMECLPDVRHQAEPRGEAMIYILSVGLYKEFWTSRLKSLGLLSFFIVKQRG